MRYAVKVILFYDGLFALNLVVSVGYSVYALCTVYCTGDLVSQTST